MGYLPLNIHLPLSPSLVNTRQEMTTHIFFYQQPKEEFDFFYVFQGDIPGNFKHFQQMNLVYSFYLYFFNYIKIKNSL